MKRTFLYLLCCLLAVPVFAQLQVSIPYSMGFEESDSLELKNWVLNPGVNASKCVDQWVVGDAVKSDGRRALYISTDDGMNTGFGIAKNVQYVYRDILLPKGYYELSFDWCCKGSADAVMYAGIGPANSLDMQASYTSSVVDSKVAQWCNTLGKMSDVSLWRNASMKVNSNGNSTLRLFFVWSSSNQDTTIVSPMGGCVDNIQICSANCAKPKSMVATSSCDSIMVRWNGTSEKYNFEYRRRGQKWSTPTSLEQEWFLLENMEEGLYDFRVRGICNSVDTSAYAYLNSYVLFCPAKHCINYVDLYGSDVTCTYGTFNDPYASTGVIDSSVFGVQEKFYRHTVNWEPDRYDPRTCNQLPLIPDGELASVRLGNWNNGAEGESVSYQYVADIENAAILFLKYAIVLEDPGHGASANPRFTLEILDESGSLLSPTCGAADFYADASRLDGGWHVCNMSGYSPISWKEWTTVGLNLAELGVQTGDVLTIRLTTKDCSWSAHFGYAYFTLGCAAARLYGTSCGNDASMSIDAPEGFRYEWYNKYDSLVSTNKSLDIEPSDTTTYRCRLIYTENEECDFNLYTSLRPRFPVADFSYRYDPSNCENKVRFYNKSHIMTVFDGDTVYHYDESCEDYRWSFGQWDESVAKNPVFSFPMDGGTFPVTLFASISEGACMDDTTILVTLPAIGNTEEVLDMTICEGSYLQFGKYYAAEQKLYYDSLVSVAGCDSVMILDLKVNPVDKIVLPDTTVCAEEPLCIDGECYKHTSSGQFVRFKQNIYGCDSTIWMSVTMQDSILPIVVIKEPKDTVGSGTITLGGTGYDYYLMNGVRYDASQTFFSGLDGGVFSFEFFNDFGCSIVRSDTMFCECLQIRLGDVGFTCLSDAELVLPLVIDSGIPTTYSLLFDSTALAAGFVNRISYPITKKEKMLTIPLPTGVKPYRYHAQLIFHNQFAQCEEVLFDLELPVHFASDLVFQRWGDVLSVCGPSYNGGFEFDRFQWVKDGEDIPGATRSYYYEEGGLTGKEYQVRVWLKDGTELTNCPYVPVPYQEVQQPQKKIENQRLVIIKDGVRYNALGVKMDNVQ